jgi:excisionase family DNA binding protein
MGAMRSGPNPVLQPGELLKSDEVARLLRVHVKQVYRLLAQGLPARRVGSEWRFVREEVLAWSQNREGGRGAALPAVAPHAGTLAPRPPPLIAANGDVVVEALLRCMQAESKPLLGLVQADCGAAFEHLAAGTVLLAGFHGQPVPPYVSTIRLARIHLARRDIGLAHPVAVQVRGVKDLARKRLADRAASAGVRRHLDAALAAAATTLTALRTKVVAFEAHRDAACALARGEVDVALTTSGWAARVGMQFHRLATESYDLVVRAENLGLPECVAVCEVAQSRAFRDEMARMPGYDPSASGEIRYDTANA